MPYVRKCWWLLACVASMCVSALIACAGTLLPNPGYRLPLWSPDGQYVAMILGYDFFPGADVPLRSHANAMVLFNPTTATSRYIACDFDYYPGEIPCCWAPDGKQLWVETSTWDDARKRTCYPLYTIGIDGTMTRITAKNDLVRVLPISWSPDGQHIAYRTSGPKLVTNSPSWNDEQAVLTDVERLGNPVWTGDGTALIVSIGVREKDGERVRSALDNNADLWRVDVQTGEKRQLTDTPNIHEYNPAISRDGKQLAYAAYQVPNAAVYPLGDGGYTLPHSIIFHTTMEPFQPQPLGADAQNPWKDAENPSADRPRFTPDGQGILMHLDGYRDIIWWLNTATDNTDVLGLNSRSRKWSAPPHGPQGPAGPQTTQLDKQIWLAVSPDGKNLAYCLNGDFHLDPLK